MVKYQQIFNFLRKTMKKKRLIFWIFTLIIAAAVCGVINFYFNFENTAKRSCESGNIESCYELGVSYTNGEKVKKDYLKAIPYFEKLCDKNYKSSCYYTAYLYSSDDLPFEKQDYEKSLNIYSSLCANKDFNACIGAGWLYATNR
ncbi:MAG: hypothetical protein LBT96_00060, partial [Campylobacteraceae bacterium]|nr:hypothetical protein [Campylobacteraceae bacterium]